MWMDAPRGTIDKYGINNYVTKLRSELTFSIIINSHAAQSSGERAWQSIARFFRYYKKDNNYKRKSLPKFKKNSKTLEYKTSGWKLIDPKHLRMSDGIAATFKLIGSHDLSFYSRDQIKRVSLIRRADGYYASFIVDVTRSEPQPPTGNTIGLDLGLKHYYTDSTGTTVENPKFLEKQKRRLKKLQRRLSKTEKGSSNRKKAINKVARKHLKISRQRKDFVTKLARCVVKSNDFVSIENLSIKNMQKNHRLAGAIGSASWYIFRQWLEYYGKIFGKVVIAIDPRNTSQDCSGCGTKVPKTLSEGTHSCEACGLVLDRDHNAALNILKRGLSTAGHAGIYASGDESLYSEQATASEQALSMKEELVSND
jgi:putative transposase